MKLLLRVLLFLGLVAVLLTLDWSLDQAGRWFVGPSWSWHMDTGAHYAQAVIYAFFGAYYVGAYYARFQERANV